LQHWPQADSCANTFDARAGKDTNLNPLPAITNQNSTATPSTKHMHTGQEMAQAVGCAPHTVYLDMRAPNRTSSLMTQSMPVLLYMSNAFLELAHTNARHKTRAIQLVRWWQNPRTLLQRESQVQAARYRPFYHVDASVLHIADTVATEIVQKGMKNSNA
jgi:hypothetical protein